MSARLLCIAFAVAALPGAAWGQGVFFNPISATNAVAGGGTEDQFALANANIAAAKVQTAGLSTTVMSGSLSTTVNSSAAVDAANAAKADVFVMIASDAGGGHGPETFYFTGSADGLKLATDLQAGMLAHFTLPDRKETANNTWDVLKRTTMPAAVSFVVFHDCTTSHATLPSAQSESAFLRDPAGQQLIGTGIAAGTCTFLGTTCPVSTCTPGGACTTGKKGVCAPGTISCSGNTPTCNQNVQPATETCNGIDDNCDGQTDEGDPGGGASCTPGLKGVCNNGVIHCQGGHLKCVQAVQPSPELCNGLDDNCDGQTDEGDPGGGGACSTGLKGVCAAGVNHCQGGKIVCVQTTQPSVEKCDGLDNNCDGNTDEGGVCADAGTPAGKDAGHAGLDASATPGLDAHVVAPGMDASASAPGPDAEAAGSDAGATTDVDTGFVLEQPDASAGLDAALYRPPSGGACGCTSGGEGTALLGLWALAALLRARRRVLT